MKTKPDLTNGYYAVRGSRDFYKGTSFRCNVWSENTHYFHDENYVDFVVYDGTLLMCMRNHISSEDNQPILKREGTVAVGLERNPLWEFVIGGVYSNGSISGDQIKLKIDGETLYMSYNGGVTWMKVGSVGSPAVEPPKYTASVASVSSGTTADASVNVVNNDFKFTFSIPRGTDGKDGANGKDGAPGESEFKSFIFTRSEKQPATPGDDQGSYSDPVPTVTDSNGVRIWHDTIPDGWLPVWVSTRNFNINGPKSSWSTPRRMVDTSDFIVVYGDANVTKIDITQPEYSLNKFYEGDANQAEAKWLEDINKKLGHTGWRDTAEESTGAVYMASCKLSGGVWSSWSINKIKGEKGDSGGYDYIFKLTEINKAPDAPAASQEDNHTPEGWYQYPQTVTETDEYQWVSTRHKVNNEWSAYSQPVLYNSYATEGIAPSATFKSFAFCRTNNIWSATDGRPTGGTYEKAWPTSGKIGGTSVTWSDTIPTGNGAIWMTTAVFDSKKNTESSPEWSIPIQWSDTANLQIEYSAETTYTKLENLQNYYNEFPNEFEKKWREKNKGWGDDVPNAIWMAVATMSNGIWSDWTVYKIKGENGTDGTSFNLLGNYKIYEALIEAEYKKPHVLGDAYTVNFINVDVNENFIKPEYNEINGKIQWVDSTKTDPSKSGINNVLFIYDGDTWEYCGKFGGSEFIHIKYAEVVGSGGFEVTIDGAKKRLQFTDPDGETPGDYIGIYTDNNSDDPTDGSLYKWSKWTGNDGWGYQYIYKLSKTNKPFEEDESGRPLLPSRDPEKMDDIPEGWSDDPIDVTEEFPYCWMCYSQSDENGGWSDWKGTYENKPALWAKWGVDGAPGESGAGYQQCFHLSTVDKEKFDESGIELRPTKEGLNGWTTSAQGVSSSNPVEWRCDRVKLEGSDTWSDWSAPHVFSHFGKNGEDGAGLEYVFLLVDSDVPVEAIKEITKIPIDSEDYQNDDHEPTTNYNLHGRNYQCKWTDNQSTVTAENPFLYSSIRRKKKGQWQAFEEPVLWNRYHRDGTDGQMALTIKVWKRGYPTLQTNDKPGAATYNLNEHTLTFTGSANGWSFDMPSHMSNSTLYSYSAYITGTITENITINEADWKGPNIESVDGKDGSGQSATYITVYPDSILVNVDDSGKARFDQTITGYANYYYGTGKLDSTVTISCDNNSSIGCSKVGNNSFTITIPKDTVIGSNDSVTVVCKPDKNSVSSGGGDVTIYELSSEIPINKIASNDVYSLTVTPNQIIAPNLNDWSQDITCTVIKNGKECPVSDENVSVENLINGKPETLNPDEGSTTHKYTYTVNNDNFDDLSNELTFVLKINDISVAHQTVSLIKNGTDGNSVIGVYEYYLWTDKNTTPTGFTPSDVKIEGGTALNIVVNGETWNANKPIEFNQLLPYLWNVEVIKIGNENASEYTVTSPSLISTSGRGIESITEYYLLCDNASGITHTNEQWEAYDSKKHVPTDTSKYLWNYEHIRYTDGTDHKTPPTIVTFWNKGADGRSIADVIEYYLYTNTADAPIPDWDNYSVTLSEGGSSSGKLVNTDGTEWTQDALPTDKGTYLWNVEVIVYKDSGDDYTHTSCILLSDRANEIKSIEEYYMIGKVGTDVTFNKDVALKENWSGTDVEGETWYKVANPQFVPVPTNDYPYLWNAEKITYLGGTEEYTSPICLGVLLKGDAGDNSYNLSVELSEDMYSVVIDKESRFSIDTYSFDQIVSLYENGQETSISKIDWTNPQPDNIEIMEDASYNEKNKKKFNITIKNSCIFNGNSLTLSCTCKTSDNQRQASKNCTIIALLEDNRYKLVCTPARLIKKYNNVFVNGSSITCAIFDYNDVKVTDLDGYSLWYTYDDINYDEVQEFIISANKEKDWCKVYLVYGDKFNINKIRDYVLVEISTLPKPEISYTVTPNVLEYDVRDNVIVNNAEHHLSHTFLYDGQMVNPATVEVGYYKSDEFDKTGLTTSNITAYGFDLQITNVLSQNAYFVKATYKNTDNDEFVAIYPIQINKHDVNFVVTVNPDVWHLDKRIDRPNGEAKNSRTVAQPVHLKAYYDGKSVDISDISIDNELVNIVVSESSVNNHMYLTYEQQFNNEEPYTDLLGNYDSGIVTKIKLTAMYNQMSADAEILLRPGIFEFSWSGTDEIGLFGKHTIRGFLRTVNDEVITESDLQAMSLSVKFYVDGKEREGLDLQTLASSGYDANDLGVFHEFSIRIYDNVNALIFINNITRIDTPASPFENISATICVDSEVNYIVPAQLNGRTLSYSFSNNDVSYNNSNDSKIIFAQGSGGDVIQLYVDVLEDSESIYKYSKTISTYVNGAKGDPGVGITAITSGEDGSIDITTSNGDTKAFDIPTRNSITLYYRGDKDKANKPTLYGVIWEDNQWAIDRADNFVGWSWNIPDKKNNGDRCYSITYTWTGVATSPIDIDATDWQGPQLVSEGYPMIYPAGEWSSATNYIVTGSTAPYVKYNNNFYVAIESNKGVIPDKSDAWTALDKFDAIYTDILFAGKGQVGSVLFNGNWMYSQQGINVEDFHGGYTSISDIIGGKSQPNFAINCLTGEGYFSQGAFRWDSAGNIMTSGNMKALGDDVLYYETTRDLSGQKYVYTVYDLTKSVVLNRMSTADTTLNMTAIIPEKLDSLFDVGKSYSCTAYFGDGLDIYPTPMWATEQSMSASLHEIVFTRKEGFSEIDINGETFKYLNGTIVIY